MADSHSLVAALFWRRYPMSPLPLVILLSPPPRCVYRRFPKSPFSTIGHCPPIPLWSMVAHMLWAYTALPMSILAHSTCLSHQDSSLCYAIFQMGKSPHLPLLRAAPPAPQCIHAPVVAGDSNSIPLTFAAALGRTSDSSPPSRRSSFSPPALPSRLGPSPQYIGPFLYPHS